MLLLVFLQLPLQQEGNLTAERLTRNIRKQAVGTAGYPGGEVPWTTTAEGESTSSQACVLGMFVTHIEGWHLTKFYGFVGGKARAILKWDSSMEIPQARAFAKERAEALPSMKKTHKVAKGRGAGGGPSASASSASAPWHWSTEAGGEPSASASLASAPGRKEAGGEPSASASSVSAPARGEPSAGQRPMEWSARPPSPRSETFESAEEGEENAPHSRTSLRLTPRDRRRSR